MHKWVGGPDEQTEQVSESQSSEQTNKKTFHFSHLRNKMERRMSFNEKTLSSYHKHSDCKGKEVIITDK